MNCETCQDKVADFLLEELPEREAVLVHEHLNICPECKIAYQELKGTGKALEAVPEMQSIQASENFGQDLRDAARTESQKIIRTLPADKRLRMEMRHARLSHQEVPSAESQRRKANASKAGIVLILLGIGILAAGLVYLYSPQGRDPVGRKIGIFDPVADAAEHLQRRQSDRWVGVQKGAPIKTGEQFSTVKEGGARFKLDKGGVMLLAPSSEFRVRHPDGESKVWSLNLAEGEMGVLHPKKVIRKRGSFRFSWMVRTEAAWVEVKAGSEVYIKASQDPQGRRTEVRVALGQATVVSGKERKTTALVMGEAGSFWTVDHQKPKIEKMSETVPDWRVDLLVEEELQELFSGKVKLLGAQRDGLLVELAYGDAPMESRELSDWSTEVPDRHLERKQKGLIMVPTDARFSLAPIMAPPIKIAFTVHPDTPKDAEFVVTILDVISSLVSVELRKRDAVLERRIRGDRPLRKVPYRTNPAQPEKVRLEVIWEGSKLVARLITTGGRTQPIELTKEMRRPGKVWISTLRDSFFVENFKISGLIPRAWLRARLEKQP